MIAFRVRRIVEFFQELVVSSKKRTRTTVRRLYESNSLKVSS